MLLQDCNSVHIIECLEHSQSMSTNTATNVAAATKVSTVLRTAISTLLKKEGEVEVALDNVRSVAKTETTKGGWTKEMLTAQLLDSGLNPARASEVCGFVFPRHAAAREHLDAALAANAKETDLKKRIAKPVILALQRDKEGTLTLEQAIADHKAKSSALAPTRTPGGQTNQTTTATTTKKKTAAEIEDELKNLVIAALKFGKENGYDVADISAVMEDAATEVFPAEGEDDNADADAQD